MLKLLKNVRRAYKQWHALPPRERERYAEEMGRITALVRELGGTRAVSYVKGAADLPLERDQSEANTSSRDRTEVIAELQQATASILAALSSPAGALARDSIPRSVRLGGKLAGKGAMRFMRRDDP